MGEFGASRRLRGEQDYQNQAGEHAADESGRPGKLLKQRLIWVNGIRLGFEWLDLAGVHLCVREGGGRCTKQGRPGLQGR